MACHVNQCELEWVVHSHLIIWTLEQLNGNMIVSCGLLSFIDILMFVNNGQYHLYEVWGHGSENVTKLLSYLSHVYDMEV